MENGKEQVIDAQPVSEALVPAQAQRAAVLLTPVMNVELAKKRLAEFQEFVRSYLHEGEDFGTIPGTPKPTLLKPGADKLCELYGLADNYEIVSKVEDYSAEPPLFDYTIKCYLTSRRDDSLVATGMGSCNSWEAKYKYRERNRRCPNCGHETIIKGSEQYGGGWVCWKKKGGCGAKFEDGSSFIESQEAGKVINEDVPTLKNTILKMAKKRAKVDATLAATRSSGIFTQDLEDLAIPQDDGSGSKKAAQKVAQRKIAAHQARKQNLSLQIEPGPGGESKISGTGLATLLIALEEADPHFKATFMRYDEAARFWFVKTAKAFILADACKAAGISVPGFELADPNAELDEPVPIEVLEGPEEETALPVIRSVITRSKRLKGEKETKWLEVTWGDKVASCWDQNLWPALTAGVNQPADLEIKQSGGFLNVVGIRRIGARPYENNQPVRTRDDIGKTSYV